MNFVPIQSVSEDNYSSEEELKEIISEQKTTPSTGSHALKRKCQSKKEKSQLRVASGQKAAAPRPASMTSTTSTASTASAATPMTNATPNNPEKRKWSEVISDDDLADLDDQLELEMTARSSRLYVRSSGGNTTASSSCSNEDDSCVCGRRLTTPVQVNYSK